MSIPKENRKKTEIAPESIKRLVQIITDLGTIGNLPKTQLAYRMA